MNAPIRCVASPVSPSVGTFHPVGIDAVTISDGFWRERQEINGRATIAHCRSWQERVGWIDNFVRASGEDVDGTRQGREFSDSEIYKLLEAMTWESSRPEGENHEESVAELAAVIAGAQQPDGYLNTRFGTPGESRYRDFEWGHELYCYGHLIQAGVARLRTGHDDGLAEVARRAADHVCATFGDTGVQAICGHPEIETALVELSRATGESRYLDQARLFVERRGHGLLAEGEYGTAYWQDDVPFRDADALRGHAVRALYLTAGAVDVAVETDDTELVDAARRQYDAAVARRTYLTGGMGSHHQDEAFGEDFELPPDRSYCETCAGVASIMVAWRLLLATGDERYADLIERTLFNVIAAAVSEDGRSFFYANPLQVRTAAAPADPDRVSKRASAQLRAPWFDVSCCPPNIARLLASLGTYVFSTGSGGVQVHQYMPSRLDTLLDDGRHLVLSVDTTYPLQGRITIRVEQAPAGRLRLDLRIPSWAEGATLDGRPVTGNVASVEREFHDGDEIDLVLPVSPRVTVADDRIDAVRGCVAVERGPVVLCLESVDLPDGQPIDGVRLDPRLGVADRDGGAIGHGHLITREPARWPYPSDPTSRTGKRIEVPLVPYHRWGNRGPATMRVWIPADQRS